MFDPQHGEDFIFDFYAILGISREASLDDIRMAFRSLQKQYHPDRYVGLAEEVRIRATNMSRVLSRAYETLSKPESRSAYDALLADWDGPISQNGTPMIDLKRSSLAGLLRFDDAKWTALSDKIEQLSGYDPDTFALLEEQYSASEAPSPKLTEAYVKALHRRLSKLTVEEGELLQVLGVQVDNQLTAGFNHVKQIEAAMSSRKEQVEALASGVLNPMLNSGELTVLSIASSSEDAKMIASVYEKVSERTLTVSQERQEVINRLMSVSELREYRPAQNTLYPNVFIGLDFAAQVYWFYIRIKDGEATVDEMTYSQVEMQALSDIEVAQEMVDKGHSVLFVRFQEGIEPLDQVSAAVQWHFDQLNS